MCRKSQVDLIADGPPSKLFLLENHFGLRKLLCLQG